jgi:hypothetical protein
VRLVAMFGRAAWGEAFKARDLPDTVPPTSKYRNAVGRDHYRFRIHLGGTSIGKIQRYLARGGAMMFAVDFVFAVSQRAASPIRAPA